MNDFTYFGEEVDEDIAEVEVEDTPATTKNTKPTRGKDHDWINRKTFLNNEAFSSSEFIDEIKNNLEPRVNWATLHFVYILHFPVGFQILGVIRELKLDFKLTSNP